MLQLAQGCYVIHSWEQAVFAPKAFLNELSNVIIFGLQKKIPENSCDLYELYELIIRSWGQ